MLLNIFIVLAYTIIFRIKVRRSLGCSTIVEGSVGLIVRSASLGALEVFFAVFLGTLALLLFIIALTKIGNNIGFK